MSLDNHVSPIALRNDGLTDRQSELYRVASLLKRNYVISRNYLKTLKVDIATKEFLNFWMILVKTNFKIFIKVVSDKCHEKHLLQHLDRNIYPILDFASINISMLFLIYL